MLFGFSNKVETAKKTEISTLLNTFVARIPLIGLASVGKSHCAFTVGLVPAGYGMLRTSDPSHV